MKANSVRASNDSFEIETELGVLLSVEPLHVAGKDTEHPQRFLLTLEWADKHVGMELSYQDLRELRTWLLCEMRVS